MARPRPISNEHPQLVRVLQVRFIGEQDGPLERDLTGRLAELFRRDQRVRAAYLARVSYGDTFRCDLALCLRTPFGADPGMVEKTGGIFTSMFGSERHLDVVFLTAEQEAELAKVCAPFFG